MVTLNVNVNQSDSSLPVLRLELVPPRLPALNCGLSIEPLLFKSSPPDFAIPLVPRLDVPPIHGGGELGLRPHHLLFLTLLLGFIVLERLLKHSHRIMNSLPVPQLLIIFSVYFGARETLLVHPLHLSVQFFQLFFLCLAAPRHLLSIIILQPLLLFLSQRTSLRGRDAHVPVSDDSLRALADELWRSRVQSLESVHFLLLILLFLLDQVLSRE